MSPLLWVVSLLVVGLAVMVLEVFVPSGGVLGFISVMAIVAAIWMESWQSWRRWRWRW